MKKILMVLGVSSGLFVNSVSADALKNSLTNMLNEKDTSSMVNLSNLDLNAKPRPVKSVKKIRSKQAVVATINSHKVLKEVADAHLEKITRGKVSNFDGLPKKQRLRLIQEMSLPILAAESAEKELLDEEKTAIYIRTWMQKEVLKSKITDEEAKEVFDQMKQRSQEKNATVNIPAFKSVKDKIKMQIFEKKMMAKLMKDVEIKVSEN